MSATSVLFEKLKAADVNDDALFALLVEEAMSTLALADKDLARVFGTSRPTIERWRSGKNAPHPALRPRIYDYFMVMVQERSEAGTL